MTIKRKMIGAMAMVFAAVCIMAAAESIVRAMETVRRQTESYALLAGELKRLVQVLESGKATLSTRVQAFKV